MENRTNFDIKTQEDVIRLANEGCLKLYHVNLEFLLAALEHSGQSMTKEGLMTLALAAHPAVIPDKER